MLRKPASRSGAMHKHEKSMHEIESVTGRLVVGDVVSPNLEVGTHVAEPPRARVMSVATTLPLGPTMLAIQDGTDEPPAPVEERGERHEAILGLRRRVREEVGMIAYRVSVPGDDANPTSEVIASASRRVPADAGRGAWVRGSGAWSSRREFPTSSAPTSTSC